MILMNKISPYRKRQKKDKEKKCLPCLAVLAWRAQMQIPTPSEKLAGSAGARFTQAKRKYWIADATGTNHIRNNRNLTIY
jgi:hypothetical protein